MSNNKYDLEMRLRIDTQICGTDFRQTVKNMKKWLKTHLQNGPI
jgi:hypothetical protein